jgi:hypothetical protein
MADDHTVVRNPIEIQRYLGGVSYPASKQELLDQARSRGAPDAIRHAVDRLPDDRFESPAAVSKAIGQLNR